MERGERRLEHPNQERYPGRSIYVVEVDHYMHLAPFVIRPDGARLLETIIPSRKATRDYRRKVDVNDRLSAEEREILDGFERGELRSAPGAELEIEAARQAARNTFNKTKRVNLRVTERDFKLAHARAREEGIPYQTLLSSTIHKYLAGRLIERG